MKIVDIVIEKIKQLAVKVARIDYIGIARKVVNWLGRVMHKAFFEILLPKRYRGVTKRELFEIIFKSDTPAGKRFDVWLLVAIMANILLLVVDSLWEASDTMTRGAHLSVAYWVVKLLEILFTVAFTFEYYLRIYCLKRPLKYVLSFWGIIDFISIFPAYLSLFIPATQALPALRMLRLMRIFRIFKLERFQEAALHLMTALRNSAIKILVFMLFVLVASVILGTLMYTIEADKNPGFNNILTGIYWAVVTITTVGYGDLSPVTGVGRLLAVIVMLLGYSVIAVPTGIVVSESIVESRRPAKKRKKTAIEKEYDEEDDAVRK